MGLSCPLVIPYCFRARATYLVSSLDHVKDDRTTLSPLWLNIDPVVNLDILFRYYRGMLSSNMFFFSFLFHHL